MLTGAGVVGPWNQQIISGSGSAQPSGKNAVPTSAITHDRLAHHFGPRLVWLWSQVMVLIFIASGQNCTCSLIARVLATFVIHVIVLGFLQHLLFMYFFLASCNICYSCTCSWLLATFVSRMLPVTIAPLQERHFWYETCWIFETSVEVLPSNCWPRRPRRPVV